MRLLALIMLDRQKGGSYYILAKKMVLIFLTYYLDYLLWLKLIVKVFFTNHLIFIVVLLQVVNLINDEIAAYLFSATKLSTLADLS